MFQKLVKAGLGHSEGFFGWFLCCFVVVVSDFSCGKTKEHSFVGSCSTVKCFIFSLFFSYVVLSCFRRFLDEQLLVW